MLTLEQVKALETKVERAVLVINTLRSENKQLKSSLQSANRRIAELEGLLRTYEQEQSRIEEGFKEALKKLDALEDSLYSGASSKQPDEQAVNKAQATAPLLHSAGAQKDSDEHGRSVGEALELEELSSEEPDEKAPDQLF